MDSRELWDEHDHYRMLCALAQDDGLSSKARLELERHLEVCPDSLLPKIADNCGGLAAE